MEQLKADLFYTNKGWCENTQTIFTKNIHFKANLSAILKLNLFLRADNTRGLLWPSLEVKTPYLHTTPLLTTLVSKDITFPPSWLATEIIQESWVVTKRAHRRGFYVYLRYIKDCVQFALKAECLFKAYGSIR